MAFSMRAKGGMANSSNPNVRHIHSYRSQQDKDNSDPFAPPRKNSKKKGKKGKRGSQQSKNLDELEAEAEKERFRQQLVVIEELFDRGFSKREIARIEVLRRQVLSPKGADSTWGRPDIYSWKEGLYRLLSMVDPRFACYVKQPLPDLKGSNKVKKGELLLYWPLAIR